MGNEAMTTFEEALNILDDLHQSGTIDKVYGLSREAFMCLFCTLVDAYGAANNMSSEDTFEMMDLLVNTMREVHSKLGAM